MTRHVVAVVATAWMMGCGPTAATHDAGGTSSLDGSIDCPDGVVCAEGTCGTTCDGERDCLDGSDEGEAAGCAPPCAGCMVDGSCVPGTTNDACGAGGTACRTCTGGTTCSDGECLTPPSCGPDTCPDGCCRGDRCETGTSAMACGGGGAECGSCGGGASCESDAAGERYCRRPCDETTCSGCCMPDGTCAVGDDDDAACGRGGEACGTCSGVTTCVAGSCVEDGCRATCYGCCVGSVCHQPTDNLDPAHCGPQGSACDVCGEGEICNGGCVPVTTPRCDGCYDDSGACLEGEADDACGSFGAHCLDCGDVFGCFDTVCRMPPDSRWDIVLVDATFPATVDGSAWDAFGGLPDPLVSFSVGGAYHGVYFANEESTAFDNTLTPSWSESVLVSEWIADFDFIQIELRDIDVVGWDRAAYCEVSTTHDLTMESVFRGDMQVCHDPVYGGTVRWYLRPHSP